MNEVSGLILLKKNNVSLWICDGKLRAFFPSEIKDVDKLKVFIRKNKSILLNTLSLNKIYSKKDFVSSNIFKTNKNTYILSFAQEGLWFIEQYEKGSNAYHIPMLVSLNVNTDIETIKQSIKAVVQRHEVLRSVFKTDQQGND